MKNKIIVILGPTATGKSDLAVEIAREYNGEVISADSRQVYTGLDIGSGKITKKEMRGVPHHMLDVISPRKIFSISDWQKQTKKIINDIILRGNIPIICGGTGYYIQSIVEDTIMPEVPPNKVLRVSLETKSVEELFAILKKIDPRRAKEIDRHNPVRLIRAIEIATALGKVPALKKVKNNSFDFLHIGLVLPDTELKEKIETRLSKRLKKGMLREAENLHKNGVSWKRMYQLGLEYRYESLFLQNKISKQEFTQKLNTEIWHYAKRQMTWFKRDKSIQWFDPKQTKEVRELVKQFLNS